MARITYDGAHYRFDGVRAEQYEGGIRITASPEGGKVDAPSWENPEIPSLRTLSCSNCGNAFDVPRSRGQYPKRCPDCRSVGAAR